MTDLVVFLILALGTFRITRLLVEDEILDRPREALFRATKTNGFIHQLLTCYWCLSFWVAVFVVALYWAVPGVAPWVLAPFAFSAITGLIDQKASN